jgi:DNA-binding NtrC family response regulator
VPAGEIQAVLELSALEADSGRPAQASKMLRKLLERTPCGQGALRSPVLSARLLLYRTRSILDGERPDVEEAASSLAEAESFLIGRRLDELESLVRTLRRRLREKTLDRRPALPGLAHPPAARFLEDRLERLETFRESAQALVRRFEEEIDREAAESLRRQLRFFEEGLDREKRALEGDRGQPFSSPRADAIVGRSPAMRRVAELCRQAGPTTLPVLITGETGTGKELVARVIHGESSRHAAPFVSLSSAALPAELFEAELFGCIRGAYSGAEKDRPGLLASARGGTFLFDEIGEMPLALQAKILRVLERGRARPLGGVDEIEIDARYLFTTHRDLNALMEEGRFRSDLFYRLRGLEIPLPPLRERLQDLPELVEHFSNLLEGTSPAERAGPEAVIFGEDALRALASYPWPGNVRELGNAVSRLALTSRGRIGQEEVRQFLGEAKPGGIFPPALLRSRPVEQLLSLLEREHLLQLLADREGSLEDAAKALGIKLRALYDRMRRLGVRPREGRETAR